MGNGEIGYGDHVWYNSLVSSTVPQDAVLAASFRGYLRGRELRPETELKRRRVREVQTLVSEVPFGRDPALTEQVVQATNDNRKVVYVAPAGTGEQRYYDMDSTLLKLYTPEHYAYLHGLGLVRITEPWATTACSR